MPLPRLPTRLPTASKPSWRLAAPPIRRPFTAGPKLLLKEDADRTAEEVDAKKREQIEKQKRGEGEWHESLGSQSESHVKADRENVKDHDEHIEELQKGTKEASEKGEV